MQYLVDFFMGLDWYFALLIYFVLASLVVFVTSKISDCVDNLDKLTNLGAAFIGGIFLAAVTSLPELITSISSAALGSPDLIFGNILGSNFFNMLILAAVDIVFIKLMFMNKVKSMRKTNFFTIIMYLVIVIPLLISWLIKLISGNDFNLFNFTPIGISFVSIIMIVVYGISVKALANDSVGAEDNSEIDEKEEEKPNTTVSKEVIKFIAWSILLVVLSLVLTMSVDSLSASLNLGDSFAGALFLAIATSLPELTAVVRLVQLRNYDAAVGNVIGSNVFNFTIISVVDVIFFNLPVFNNVVSDKTIIVLLFFGLISAGLVMFALLRTKSKNKFVYILPSIIIAILYIVFLVLNSTILK